MDYRLFVCVFFVFGDRIRRWGVGRVLDRHAVATGLVAGRVRGRRWGLRGSHEVRADGLHQALDAVPASRVAFGVEFLLALDIVDVESVVLVIVTIVNASIRNAYQFENAQARARFAFDAFARAALLGFTRLLDDLYGGAPDIDRHGLRRRFGIEQIADLGAVGQIAAGVLQTRFGDSPVSDDLRLRLHFKVPHQFAMTHHFACTTTVVTQFGL